MIAVLLVDIKYFVLDTQQIQTSPNRSLHTKGICPHSAFVIFLRCVLFQILGLSSTATF